MSTDIADQLKSYAGWAVILLVAFALVFGAYAVLGGIGEPRGESQYTGQIVDLENERGLVLQTTQIHMKTDAEASSAETFCILDENRDAQLDQLRDASHNGDRVTVTYERPFYVPTWDCEPNTSVITSVEVADE